MENRHCATPSKIEQRSNAGHQLLPNFVDVHPRQNIRKNNCTLFNLETPIPKPLLASTMWILSWPLNSTPNHLSTRTHTTQLLQTPSHFAVFLDITKAFEIKWRHKINETLHSWKFRGNFPHDHQLLPLSHIPTKTWWNILQQQKPKNLRKWSTADTVYSPVLFNITINDTL